MTSSYDSTIIIGHLGRDATVSRMPDGRAVATFSVAVNREWRGRDGVKVSRVVWYNCAIYGALAESLSEYLLKGREVFISGQLAADENGRPRVREFQGRKYINFELTVKVIRLLGGSRQGQQASKPQAETSHQEFDYGDLDEDEFLDF